MMTDPIADMLTRIRNGVRVEYPHIDAPASKIKCGIAEVLKREGYIWDWERIEAEPTDILRVHLKYGANGEKVIQRITRKSRPGCRRYSSKADIKAPLNGLGVSIFSTNRGILSDREAKAANVGGELLCEIW